MGTFNLEQAKLRRRYPTPGQAILWRTLRRRHPRWRRQASAGGFLVDFWCPTTRHIILVNRYPEADMLQALTTCKIQSFTDTEIIAEQDWWLILLGIAPTIEQTCVCGDQFSATLHQQDCGKHL